jgi:putative transposase
MMAGIWMKSLSPSPARSTGCGVPSIRMATYWTKLSGPPQYQGREVIADPASEEAGLLPKGMISGRLRPYGAAKRWVMPDAEHRSHNGLNNRVENSHVPLRKRERMLQSFRSPQVFATLRRDLPAVRSLFVPPRSNRSVFQIHPHRLLVMVQWKAVALDKWPIHLTRSARS